MFAELAQYLPELMSLFGGTQGQTSAQGMPWLQAAQSTVNAPYGVGMGAPTTGASPMGSALSSLLGSSGGVIGGIANLIGGSPYAAYEQGLRGISPELQKYLQQSLGYLQPYQTAGLSALKDYQTKVQQMEDPVGFYKNIMGTYQESPAVKFQKAQGLQSLANQAAATGYTGSGQQLKDILRFSQGLASQGQQQYLGNILGINQQALGGLSTLAGRGQQAGTQMGAWTQQTGQELANLMSQMAAAKAGARGERESSIGSIIGSLF